MDTRKAQFTHPALRTSAAHFRALATGNVPLESGTQPCDKPLAYQDVLETLADAAPDGDYAEARDMRQLTLRELGAALASCDLTFWDAMAEKASIGQQVATALRKPGQSDKERLESVGTAIAAVLREYLHELVHIDVQELLSRRAEADRAEGILS